MAKEFKLQFEMENSIFDFEFQADEIMRILKDIENQIPLGCNGRAIMDINGNRIGEWSINE